MGEALSRVLDPAALDACDKPRGRLVIEVPRGWAGAVIEVVIPARVACARCDGGGCDGCGRRGGHRVPGDPTTRRVRVRLPSELESGVVLRILRPFGEDGAGIAQLHLEARAGAAASEGVTWCEPAMTDAPRIEPAAPRASASPLDTWRAATYATIAVALAALVAFAVGR
ncbi:hypothetical protein [Polyangium jinanense]|uniref:Uncharacterized protein n=1 Tax=Polyangium jinanense TaxID=2829994 RepID=A0A9X3X349_9BACT|nr:hypothetical protein [Polyangium jinanense]MDC3954897.1 hypothetical protein [Polyangium jinanense]MDC3981333.1 hypothetical protein [Polyangium jinanense]